MRSSCLRRVLGASLLVVGCGGDSFTATPGAGGKSSGGSSGSASGGGASSGGTHGGGGASGGSAGGAANGGNPNGGTTASGGSPAGGAPGTGGVVGVADAAPARWCDTQKAALFCADFDEQQDVVRLLNSWTTYSSAGADFSLDTAGGVPSLPNALRIRTNVDKDVKALLAEKIAPFQTPPNRLLLEFSLRIDAAANVGFLSGAAIAAILTGTDVSDGAMALEIGNGPSLVAGYLQPAASGLGFNTANVPGPFPKLNQWTGRYAIEITYGDGADASRTGCMQILAGGIRQLDKCLALPPSLVDPSFVSVGIGVYSGGLGATGDVQVRFDNVVFTAE